MKNELSNIELVILGCYETAYMLEHECRHWYPFDVWTQIYDCVSDEIFVENTRIYVHDDAKAIQCPWKIRGINE